MIKQNSITAAGVYHRDLVARWSRERTRSVQEIAPLPAMVNPKRRMACRKDFRQFCLSYFPKRFELAFSTYHLQVIARIEEIMIQGGGKLALAMPRGSGKTTLVETAVVWALLYGHCRYIVTVGSNNSAARKLINNIKQSLTENRTLQEDFPESLYPFQTLKGSALLARGQRYLGELTGIEWKPESVVFAKIPGSPASGATVFCVGIKGAIRGNNKSMPDGSIARPDVVVLDDPQTEAVARSKKQVENVSEVIDRTIEGLVGPAKELAMLMTCTVIEEGDLADTYLNHKAKPQWRGLRFKMIERMPDRMDLWEKYRDLRNEEDAGKTKAKMFYKQNRSAMREGAIVAWEANYTDDDLDALQYAMNKWAENDTGYKPQIVENAIRLAVGRSAVVMPSKGKSIRAVNLPMSGWNHKPGERFGNHWVETTPAGRMRTYTIDTNFWKCQVHDAFRMLPGNRGSLTLWGRDQEQHRMFSDHLNGETAKLVLNGTESFANIANRFTLSRRSKNESREWSAAK